MSRIRAFETWICRRDIAPATVAGTTPEEMRSISHGNEVVLIRLTTEDGTEGIATALPGRDSRITLGYLETIVAPIVLGRSFHEREAIWQDLVRVDRKLAFFPVHLPGPVDVALWDIAAKHAGLPLYQYLGVYRSSLPYYASSQFMFIPEDYIADAQRYTAAGATAYKIHPGGDWRHHIEIAEAVRSQFPQLVLMLDPGGSYYTLPQAMAVGRALERLNFTWLEEPFPEVHLSNYVELCRALDIPIAATEATQGGIGPVAEFIKAGAADIVRADVSWKWGVTGTLKICHLAEAFGINCEIHTTSMGPMEIANLHVACAVSNCEFFELYTPHQLWSWPMKQVFSLDEQGRIHVPEGPGLGIDIDWDAVDQSTHRMLTWPA
jgi:L-alanine-DL-glutamate epimerase-like enolase superfamily enzyme